MLDPATAFSLAGLLAMVGWAGCCSSLFVKAARPMPGPRPIVVPALLAVAYVLLIQEGMRAAEGGGFGSIDEVRALFANNSALAAGWLHYLAFDLFVGTWIAREGPRRRRPRPAARPLPCPHLPVRPRRTVALPDPALRLPPRARAWRPTDGQPRSPLPIAPPPSSPSCRRASGRSPSTASPCSVLALPLARVADVRSAHAPRRQRLGEAGQVPGLGRRLLAHRGLVLRLYPARAARRRPPMRADRLDADRARAASSSLWIGWQAEPRASNSHFNISTAFFSIMYALMGVSAVLLVGDHLAARLGNRPPPGRRPPPRFRRRRRDRLAPDLPARRRPRRLYEPQTGPSVGAEGGHVPLFGWNRSGGDLRIAHFLGIHAQQAIPILLALAAPLAARMRWLVSPAGSHYMSRRRSRSSPRLSRGEHCFPSREQGAKIDPHRRSRRCRADRGDLCAPRPSRHRQLRHCSARRRRTGVPRSPT